VNATDPNQATDDGAVGTARRGCAFSPLNAPMSLAAHWQEPLAGARCLWSAGGILAQGEFPEGAGASRRSRNRSADRRGVNYYMLITYLQGLLAQVRRGEEGQTAVEYGLVIALIALVIVGILATAMTGVIGNVVDQINAAL
jgi:pilus assembly protein Flp/PilA